MIAFEVYRNGEKNCTAGFSDYGVITALLSWVSYSPEKLAQWAADGRPVSDPVSLDFSVGGLCSADTEPAEHLRWLDTALTVGDEIRICIVDIAAPDPPLKRYPVNDGGQKRPYDREPAEVRSRMQRRARVGNHYRTPRRT